MSTDDNKPVSENTSEIKTDDKNGGLKKEEQIKGSPLQDAFEIVDAIIVAVIMAILILSLLFRTGFVDGPSMQTTMMANDRYIVSGLFYTPAVGDIVVFQPQDNNPTYSLWVKRVIATEGQVIDINGDGKVYIDGVEFNEPYISQETYPKTFSSVTFPLTVPEGYVFLMGDNRGNSTDGRDIGCVDVRRILGKVLFRFYPLNKIGSVS